MNNFDNRQPELADLKAVMALMEHGTVTRAAQTLGTSQSALSYQLERMRKRFGDALFVRIGNRMAATPFTQRLAEPASRVLRIMETEIGGLQSFDPATTRREYRIGMNELGAITLVPRLVRRLAELAPYAALSPVQLGPENLSAALESGQLDMALPARLCVHCAQGPPGGRQDTVMAGLQLGAQGAHRCHPRYHGLVGNAVAQSQLRSQRDHEHSAHRRDSVYRRRQRHGGDCAARVVRAVFTPGGAENRAPTQSHSGDRHTPVLAPPNRQRPVG